ncbi:CBO0543 family protein [Halalkalibacter lacteus]|uniref:CBO0543 family protein n=1 Tax=Halalkalibacter lacteus TaxID=3090663 RepID=UPI002FC7ACF5
MIPNEIAKNIDQTYKVLVEAQEQNHAIWIEYVFLSWQWWLCLFVTIIPWVIWWYYRKKRSTNRLLLGAFFIISISMFLDSFGAELGYWDYRYEVLPFLPSFLPWDLSLIPVFFLFLSQIKPHIHPMIKAISFSAIASFLGEPIFEWLGFYHSINWSSFYSFLIYIGIYLIGHYLVSSKNFEPLL